jgi:hypothetical protein
MVPPEPAVDGTLPLPGPDADSRQWVRALAGTGPQQEAALARLHALLLRIAQGEVRRRAGRLRPPRRAGSGTRDRHPVTGAPWLPASPDKKAPRCRRGAPG